MNINEQHLHIIKNWQRIDYDLGFKNPKLTED